MIVLAAGAHSLARLMRADRGPRPLSDPRAQAAAAAQRGWPDMRLRSLDRLSDEDAVSPD